MAFLPPFLPGWPPPISVRFLARLAALRSPHASSLALLSLLLRSHYPVAQSVLPCAPLRAGNPAAWLLALSRQSAHRASPIPGTSPSRALPPQAAADHAATEIYSADAARAVDLSWPLRAHAPDPAALHAPHPAPTPPSTRRLDNSVPASTRPGGPSSRDLQLLPAPRWAPSLRTSPPSWLIASPAHRLSDPPHNKIATAPPAPVSSPDS